MNAHAAESVVKGAVTEARLPEVWSDNLHALADSIGPLLLAAILLSLMLTAIFYRAMGKGFLETLLFVSPFAWLGAVCGFIAGSSKEQLIGALLTGVLTVAGTLITFMIGKDSESDWRRQLPLAMMLLFLCALVGITSGGVAKGRWEDFDREYARWQSDYETVTLPAKAALQRYNLCVAKIPAAARADCNRLLLGGKGAAGTGN